MPLAKIHVLEGQYDEARMNGVSAAIQEALINVLKVPPDDFFQIIHVLPRSRFRHTPSFLGLKYSDDLIVLELTFISGRPKDTRLALLKELNERIVARTATISMPCLMPWTCMSGSRSSSTTGARPSASTGPTATARP